MKKQKKYKSAKDYKVDRVVCFSLPTEYKKQLQFTCQLKGMTVSELCRIVIMKFLNRNDIAKLMIEYALEHIAKEKMADV